MRTERIAELLEQTFEGRAYYGNSVLGTPEDISWETAAKNSRRRPRRPVPAEVLVAKM